MPAPSDFPSPQHGRSGPTNKVRGEAMSSELGRGREYPTMMSDREGMHVVRLSVSEERAAADHRYGVASALRADDGPCGTPASGLR